MKIENEPNKTESFRTRIDEINRKKHIVQRAIKSYFDEHGIEPNLEILSQITEDSVSKLKSIINQIDLYSYKMYNLEGQIGTPQEFSLFYLRADKKHKTFFLYDGTIEKYLPMRMLDIIYDNTSDYKHFNRNWIKKIIVEVEYPENGWTVLMIPDSEIHKYYFGRVVVNFVDLPDEVFDSLEDALDAIKIWKARSVVVTDKPDVWSGFSHQRIKTTNITDEVSSMLPNQIVNLDSEEISLKEDKQSLGNHEKMDEVVFAKMQKEKCGFTGIGIAYEDYISIRRKVKKFGIDQLNISEQIKLAFLMTFGAHQVSINLDEAQLIVEKLYNITRLINPFEDANDELSVSNPFYDESNLDKNDVYISWLKKIGHLSILLGTIYAYKNEIIKSCYYFMQGLKTENLDISHSYYDFIDYILSKLNDIPKFNYSEDPINNIDYGFSNSIPVKLQNRIISDFVNDIGDMIVAHYQNGHLFGRIKHNEKDICETLIITNNFELKCIRFVLNQRMEPITYDMSANFDSMTIPLPDNFRIKKHSALLQRKLYFESDIDFHRFGYHRFDANEIVCSGTSIELKFDNNMHPIY